MYMLLPRLYFDDKITLYTSEREGLPLQRREDPTLEA